MILLVLLHKGKGSGLSDLFGGGVSSNYGGSSVVEKNLDRITIVVGGLWFAGDGDAACKLTPSEAARKRGLSALLFYSTSMRMIGRAFGATSWPTILAEFCSQFTGRRQKALICRIAHGVQPCVCA